MKQTTAFLTSEDGLYYLVCHTEGHKVVAFALSPKEAIRAQLAGTAYLDMRTASITSDELEAIREAARFHSLVTR